MSVAEIRVALIDAEGNVREKTDEGLVTSIRQHGVLQPIVVRRTGKRYRVVMGFRRLAAARHLDLATIPALVEDEQHDDEILRQVAENIHRKGMNPLDVARAVATYLDAHPDVTKQQLGIAMGFKPTYGATWVSNKLALLRLDADVQDRVATGDLTQELALKQRARLHDGRGHPRIVSEPDEDGRSKSIVLRTGRTPNGSEATIAIGVEHVSRSIDMVVGTDDRNIFLVLTPDEAKVLGRRLTQAYEAVA